MEEESKTLAARATAALEKEAVKLEKAAVAARKKVKKANEAAFLNATATASEEAFRQPTEKASGVAAAKQSQGQKLGVKAKAQAPAKAQKKASAAVAAKSPEKEAAAAAVKSSAKAALDSEYYSYSPERPEAAEPEEEKEEDPQRTEAAEKEAAEKEETEKISSPSPDREKSVASERCAKSKLREVRKSRRRRRERREKPKPTRSRGRRRHRRLGHIDERNPGKAPKRSRKSPPVEIDSRNPTPQLGLTPRPPQYPPPQWAEKKPPFAIIGQSVVTEDATPEDLGKLLNATPVHILVLFFAVAESVDIEGCSRRDEVMIMVSAAVAANGKFDGLWMPGAAVLAAKERFKCPHVIESMECLSGHYWCVDVTSSENYSNPEFSLRLAVVYNCPPMSAVADARYLDEFMEQVRGAIARFKVQVLMGPLGKDPAQIGKLVYLYKPHEAALFFQAWRRLPGEAERLPRVELEAGLWLPGQMKWTTWGNGPLPSHRLRVLLLVHRGLRCFAQS